MTVAPALRDDVATLLAAGVLAYVAETMLHEAFGHGGVCLLQGHEVLVLAPLWMRCSAAGWLMTLAGPTMNVAAAAVCAAVLSVWRGAGLLVWLSFAFNALVAWGYLGVGAATGFGDWPVIFAGVTASAMWRVPAMLVSVGGFYLCLRLAARLFVRMRGGGPDAARDLRRRALVPAAGAAIVACLAEIVGRRAGLMSLSLALGCTIGVGYALTSMDDAVRRAGPQDIGTAIIARSWRTIVVGVCIALAFVFFIGPGLTLEAAK